MIREGVLKLGGFCDAQQRLRNVSLVKNASSLYPGTDLSISKLTLVWRVSSASTFLSGALASLVVTTRSKTVSFKVVPPAAGSTPGTAPAGLACPFRPIK